MSRPAPRVLSGGSFWNTWPVASWQEVERILGQALSQNTRDKIEFAFFEYDSICHSLSAPTVKQYVDRLEKIKKAIDTADSELRALQGDRSMMDAINDQAARDKYVYRGELDLEDVVNIALTDLNRLSLMLIFAQKPDAADQFQSHGDAKRWLVRELAVILKDIGITPKPGHRHSGAGTPFERFIARLGIHKANSEDALRKWLYEIL